MTNPVQHSVHINGIDLCYFEWGARSSDQPTLLLVHATGFHARCWDQVVAGCRGHIISVDMRGHGRSGKAGPLTWSQFGADLSAFIEALKLERIVAAGHSMGGHSLVQAALAHGARFARLVLVDPVMLAPETYADAGVNVGAESVEDHPVSRRRNQWRDWQQMYERFADRDPFSLWQPAVLEDYCRWGVVPDPDQAEGFVLACPPAVEAGIYLGSASVSLTEHLADVTMPVTVIRGRQNAGARLAMDFSASPTWSELAHQFPRGVDVSRPDLTHFIPMQEPQLVADYLMGRR